MSAIEVEWAPLPLSKPGPLLLLPNLGPGPVKPPASLGGGPTRPLGSDMELQKMLTDERLRCEILLKNYKDLHAEYTSLLQSELTQRQGELKQLVRDKLSHQESLELLLQLRGELQDKTTELEEVRLQAMTPQRLEFIRAQLQQEMEGPVREHFHKLEEKIEKYRSEYNKLLYEHILLSCENISLKSQFDDDSEEESEGEPEETEVRFEAETARPERHKEGPVAQDKRSDPSRDGKRMEAPLKEENVQLHVRLKGLEAEVAELRAQNTRLAGRLHEAEREVDSLTCQVENMKHTLKLEAAGVRSKAEAERESDTAQAQTDGQQSDVEVLKESAKRLQREQEVLTEKDMELIRKVQATRAEEFYKTWLENRLAEMEHEIVELEQQNQRLGVQLGTLSRSQSDLVETNEHLREMLDSVCEELRATRVEAEKSQYEAAEKLVDDRRAEWSVEEKHKLQQRDTELQDKYSKDKLKPQRNYEIAQLELEVNAAQKCPSFSAEDLCRQLRELHRAM